MSKVWTLGLLGLAFVAMGLMRADAAGPAAIKIGYIDLQRTLNETRVGKAAKSRLEAEKARRQKEIDQQQDKLKADAEQLEKQRVVLKADALKAREKDLQDKYVALQNRFLQFQQELAKKEAELTKEIFVKASEIIGSVAKREGFTMILEKNEGAVLYADPSLDITDEVNRSLDAVKRKGK